MLPRVLTALGAGFMAVLMASCGQTYKLDSITVAPATGYNLVSPGQTGPLTVTATYSNTKTNDVTANSSYELGASPAPGDAAPLSINGVPTVTVNKSGVVTASSSVGVCTWVATTTGTTTTYATYPYPVTITYAENGVTVTASAPISVATLAGCNYPQSTSSDRPSSPERAQAAESSRPR
jgi:hypothetical protein